LLLALIESEDRAVSAAITKLGHDSFEMLRELRDKISRIQGRGRRMGSPSRRRKKTEEANRAGTLRAGSHGLGGGRGFVASDRAAGEADPDDAGIAAKQEEQG